MKKWVGTSVSLIVLAWMLNLWIDPPAYQMRSVINEARLITGVLAWAFMAGCIVIAARPPWIERVTRTSLDELYRWHKYLGIATVVASLAHFYAKDTIRALRFVLEIAPSGKKIRVPATDWFDQAWMWLKEITQVSGEWVFYGMLILTVLCFVKRLPYSRWLTTHRLFSVFFLILAPHALRLMPVGDHLTPLGLINIAITGFGCWYAVRLLVRGPGAEMTQKVSVTDVLHQDGVTLVSVQTQSPLNIQAGQFAFLESEHDSKHPYTMIETKDNRVKFAIKALGDHTTHEVPTWTSGTVLHLEGPWGCFVADQVTPRQMWIAGGIGIAPFIAWLKAHDFRHFDVELLWCIKHRRGEVLFDEVVETAQKAGVRLTVVESSVKRLDLSTLFEKGIPDGLAICAPDRLKRAVKSAYVRAGGQGCAIRSEHFSWRE